MKLGMLDGDMVEGTYLAFDFGTKHMGIAVGQTITRTANPLTTLTAQQGQPDWRNIELVIQQWQPQGLIVGLPLQIDGTHSKTSLLAAQFAKQLNERFNIAVFTIEERLTSVAADEEIKTLKSLGLKNQSQDAIAASLILESWFNQVAKGSISHANEKSSI